MAHHSESLDSEFYLFFFEKIFLTVISTRILGAVALHSLYLRTVRSRTLQVRLLFSTTHYYP